MGKSCPLEPVEVSIPVEVSMEVHVHQYIISGCITSQFSLLLASLTKENKVMIQDSYVNMHMCRRAARSFRSKILCYYFTYM